MDFRRWSARFELAAVLAMTVAGCTRQGAPLPAGAASARHGMLVLLTRDGCSTTDILRKNLDATLRAMGRTRDYEVLDQATLVGADPRRGYPTPTLLFASRDVFGLPEPTPPFPEPT